MAKSLQEVQEIQVPSLGWEDPLEKEMATYSSILAWRIHGQRSLASYSPWGPKESDTTEQLSTQGRVSFGYTAIRSFCVDRDPQGSATVRSYSFK